MNIKRIFALLLALLLTMSACAFAEAGGVAAEEEVPEHDYEVITDPVIITFGEREIHVSEVMTRFMNYYQTLSSYESYGITPASFLTQIKKTVLSEVTQELIEEVKIAELGYDQFTAEEQAVIDAQIEETFNDIYLYYYDYATYNSAPDADIAAIVNEYLEHYDYTKEDIQKKITHSYAADKMATDLTKDITVTPEVLLEYYNALVAQDQAEYENNRANYEDARTYGTDDMFCWNPEGYRRVLQVLIGFETEEAKTEYNQLRTWRQQLFNGETPTAAEGETVPTIEEINARMAELEAPLKETAAEVTEKFNNGATIEELMAEYSADQNTPAEGYYVNFLSELYDVAFVDAAFSVNEIGQLSAGYAGQHGVYMVYYLADVPAGPVPLEELSEQLMPICLTNMQKDAYFTQLNEWKTELGIVTDIEMFITGYEQ